jgi:hypothetical protein
MPTQDFKGTINGAAYEATTWSPTLTSTTGTITSVTYGTNVYTVIGRMVFAQFEFTITNNGTGATLLKLAGLPYNIANVRPFGVIYELDVDSTNVVFVGIVGTDYILLSKLADKSYPGATSYHYMGGIIYTK